MLAGGIFLIILGLGMVFGLQDPTVGNFNIGMIGWVLALGGVGMIALHFINRRTPPAMEPRRKEVVVDKTVDSTATGGDVVVDRRDDVVVERRDDVV